MVGLCWKRCMPISRNPARAQPEPSRSPAGAKPEPSPAETQPEPSPAEAESLSVQQHEGLEPLRDVSAVRQAVFDDGARGQTLQGGVVDGLDQVLGHLLLVQQIARRLLEGVGAVEVRAAGDQ